MDYIHLKTLVKSRSISELKLSSGKSVLERAGIKTVGAVLELIDNKSLLSVEGIGSKTAAKIEKNVQVSLVDWEKEIKLFKKLPPNQEEWPYFLRLYRAIFQQRQYTEGSIDSDIMIKAMYKLPFLEYQIIKLRFALFDGRYWEAEEVANEVNRSKDYILIKEKIALKKLKNFLIREKARAEAMLLENKNSFKVLRYDEALWEEYNNNRQQAIDEGDEDVLKNMALKNEDYTVIRYIKSPKILVDIALQSKINIVVKAAFNHIKDPVIWKETYEKIEESKLKQEIKKDRERKEIKVIF